MTETTTPAETTDRQQVTHPGPPLAAPALAFVVIFAASIAVGPLSGSGGMPSPFEPRATVARFFAEHTATSAASSWLMLLSSLALVVLSAALCSRLAFLAPRAAGPVIAGFGGVAAAVLLGGSATILWVLSQDPVASAPQLVVMLHYFEFALGGPVHTAALGVLVLGVAITSLFVGRTPRWLNVVGIVLAVISIASTATFLVHGAAPLIPIGRFLSIIWILVVSFVLPKTRAR